MSMSNVKVSTRLSLGFGAILLINAVHPDDGHSTVRLRSLVANAVAAAICPIPRTYTEHYYKRFLQFTDEPASHQSTVPPTPL